MGTVPTYRKQFFAAVSSAFSFLVEQYGFSPARVEDTLSSLNVEFSSRRLLVIVVLEHRTGLLDLIVDKPAPWWKRIVGYPDPNRKRWSRYYLNELASAIETQEFSWKPWSPRQSHPELVDAVNELADVLASNFGELLSGRISLNELPAPR